MSDDPITEWICRLAAGDESAAQAIWERYFAKLVRLARRKLEGSSRRMADEEDVALSAMQSCFRRIQAGQYQGLSNRQDFWRLLVTIAAHKALDQMRAERRVKRGGGHVRGESAFDNLGDAADFRGIEQVLGEEPTPELAALTAETCRELLGQLDESLRAIVLCRLEGYSNIEIADRLGYALRTGERKLAIVRRRWERSADKQ